MKETIKSYATAADKRDIETISKIFHEDFKVFAEMDGKINVIDKTTYVSLLKAGKIGGSERKIEFEDVSTNSKIGTARIRLIGEKVTFHDNLSLVFSDERWQIVSNVTRVTTND